MNETDLDSKVDELSAPNVFQSPTLTKLSLECPQLLPPQPYPQCVNCPNSLWLAIEAGTLRCYCQAMRVISWDTNEPHEIPLCDGIYLMDGDDAQISSPNEY